MDLELLSHYRQEFSKPTTESWYCLKIIDDSGHHDLIKWQRLTSNGSNSCASISSSRFYHRYVKSGLWINIKTDKINELYIFFTSPRKQDVTNTGFLKHLQIRTNIRMKKKSTLKFTLTVMKPEIGKTLYDKICKNIESTTNGNIIKFKASLFGKLWGKNNKENNKQE